MGEKSIYHDKSGDRDLLCIDTGFSPKRFANKNNISLTSIANHIVTPNGRLDQYFLDGIDEKDQKVRFTGKFLPGKTLGDRVAENPDQAFALMACFLKAVRISSGMGLVQSYFVPHLIWVLDDGSILFLSVPLINFCISRPYESKTEILSFNHPELEGERSAVFSACTVVFNALTGHFPYQGENEIILRQKMISADPMPARNFRPELTEEAEDFLKNSLDRLSPNPPILGDCENTFVKWNENPPFMQINTELREAILKKRNNQVWQAEAIYSTNEFFKRNRKRFLISLIIVAVACFVTIPIILNILRQRVTVGLSAAEVIDRYYNAANELDIETMADCLENKKVSNFYYETENTRFQFIMPNSKFLSVPQWYSDEQRPLYEREFMFGDRVLYIEEKNPTLFEVTYEKWVAVGLETGKTGIDEALIIKELVKIEDFGKYWAITEITVISKNSIDVSSLNIST